MIKLRKFLVVILITCSIFTTGCDAGKILNTIQAIATAIQESVPAIQEIIKSVSDAVNGVSSSSFNSNTVPNNGNNSRPTDSADNSCPSVRVVSTTNEDIDTGSSKAPTNNTSPISNFDNMLLNSGTLSVPYSEAGNENNSQIASDIKSKYGITLLNGVSGSDGYFRFTSGSWDNRQMDKLEKVLSDLPSGFRSFTKGFAMYDKILDSSGGQPSGLGADPILLNKGQIDSYDCLAEVVVHEMTHLFQGKNKEVSRLWLNSFWKNGQPLRSSITDYGNTNFMEDMAESVAAFYTNPQRLKSYDPEKYNFIAKYIWK